MALYVNVKDPTGAYVLAGAVRVLDIVGQEIAPKAVHLAMPCKDVWFYRQPDGFHAPECRRPDLLVLVKRNAETGQWTEASRPW